MTHILTYQSTSGEKYTLESAPQRRMELTVKICVSLKWRQEEMIKVRSRFKHMRGQYIGQ
jgi:hypothetical protein